MGDASASTPVTRRFGRYEVTRPLGGGAMGEVFVARDTALGRDVAIKVMRRAPGVAMDLFRARFDAEARALAALRHAAVVSVFDIGWDGDDPYLVMELVPGGSLKERIDAAPLSAADVRALGIQIGGALAAAHAAGILHRDVKPANVLGGPGEWKLADFGIAHVPGSELTMTGQFLGTPAYAAPEALGEGAHTPAADVWGLGATLYKALTGEAPYGGAFGAVSTTSYVPVRDRSHDAPASLVAAIEAALDRDPARRPSATGLCAMLASEPIATARPTIAEPAARGGAQRRTARPAWMIPAIGIGVVLLIGIVAVIAGSGGGGGRAPDDRAASFTPSLPGAIDDEGASDAAMVHVLGDGSIAIDRAQLDAPRSEDAAHRLDDAIRKAEDGKLDEALDRLDDIVAEDPSDRPAQVLRASLSQLRDQGYGERRGPPGRRKHKHDD